MSESDSDEDNIIRYGTPLDPYEEDEIPSKRKYQQQPDQYAVDAHGRRRFHGAFTGGFSAGYGNSVGSAEGWTPASFKSSRLEKTKMSSQKPEDFMDEEDRSEFGIAPRHMQTHSDFSGQKRPQQQRYFDGPIPGEPVLEQLVHAVHETAAVRMLRAMGWREGQGAGQRVTRGERREARDRHRVYGCYIPKEMRQDQQQSDEENSDSEFEYDTLFAPEDYEPYLLHRKNDRFGLGYSGLSRHSVLGNMTGEYESGTSSSHLLMKEKGKKVSIRGQAFGVGALEADDEDIYSKEDMSHYDFAIGSVRGDKPKAQVNKEKGVNVLEGFVKATKPLPSVPSHPPPALPRDYNPQPAGAKRSRFEPTTQAPRNQSLGRHELTAEARGALLGETPVPPVAETIAQPNTQTNKVPLLDVLGRNVNFVTTADKDTKEENKAEDFISIKDTGKELTKVFKPFVNDPKKQARYELFLSDKNTALKGDGNMDRLSEWERNREIAEFEQASKLYKPLTGIMGDRFTHASEPDTLNPLCAVAKSSINYGLATAEQIEAAENGLYGVMTRRQVTWRPESHVCKRFNVPDPMGNRPEKPKEDKPKVSYSVFSYLESSIHDKDSFTREQSKFSGSKSLNINTTLGVDSKTNQSTPKNNQNVPVNDKNMNKVELDKITEEKASTSGFNRRMTVAELFLKESEKDLTKNVGTEVTETINKFDKMDLYKSIFLSDSENEDEQTKIHENVKEKDVNDFIGAPKNVERNLSPPRGIFANIDFDELNSWKRNVDNKNTTTKVTTEGDSKIQKTSEEKGNIDVTEAALYGPKIPDNLTKRLQEPSVERDGDNHKPTFNKNIKERDMEGSSSSSDSWVEAKEKKSKKEKKKKDKKHKSHKHKKSKHKKNKK